MIDYISRQAAIEWMGDRPDVWVNSEYELGQRNQYDSDIFAIEHVPSADVTEVIRCKECNKQHSDDCPMYFEEWYEWDEDGYTEMDYNVHDHSSDDGYCDKAERRTDEP